jgi:hypothetical protein
LRRTAFVGSVSSTLPPIDEKPLMHPAALLPVDRLTAEYQRWMAVPDRDRSPAPGWWWGPAMALREMPGDLPGDFAKRLGLPDGASCAVAAQVFLDALAEQTALPWPEQFPRPYRPAYADETPAEAG